MYGKMKKVAKKKPAKKGMRKYGKGGYSSGKGNSGTAMQKPAKVMRRGGKSSRSRK